MMDYIARFFPVAKHSLSYNRAIDGLRGIAVGVVLIFHIWPDLFSFGYVGVDVFFVISGYLITQIIYNKLKKDNFSFMEFYRNRVRRIFPSMLLVTSAVLALGYFLLTPLELEVVAKHVKSSSLFYQNFRLMGETGYWDSAVHLKPLLHYWSLSIEEQYYLIWPTVVLVVYRLRRDFFYSMLVITLALMIVPHIFGVDLFFHSLSRFWELSFGGLTYAVTTKIKNIDRIDKYQVVIILFFLVGMLIGYNTSDYSTWKTIILIVSTSFAVMLVSFKPEQKLFSFYPLVFLGLISYPLYLWHYVIISYLHVIYVDVEKYGIIVAFVSIMLAYLTYRFLEYYTRGIKSYKFMVFLLILTVCLAATAQYVRKSNGLPDRAYIGVDKDTQEQLDKPSSTDKEGVELVSSVLGHKSAIHYIKATSADKSKKYIALIGDSHAFVAYKGFANSLKSEGYEVILLANDGVSPLYNGAMGSSEKNLKKNTKRVEEIYAFLNGFENVEKVIFVSRGKVYAEQAGYDGEEFRNRFFGEYFENKDNYNNAELFFEKLDNTFAYFNSRSELYFVLENPELGFQPINNCIKRAFGFTPKNPDCSITHEAYTERTAGFKSKVRGLAEKYENVHVLDPEKAFCYDGKCYGIVDGKLLYKDDDHLSLNGSVVQAEYLTSEIVGDRSE